MDVIGTSPLFQAEKHGPDWITAGTVDVESWRHIIEHIYGVTWSNPDSRRIRTKFPWAIPRTTYAADKRTITIKQANVLRLAVQNQESRVAVNRNIGNLSEREFRGSMDFTNRQRDLGVPLREGFRAAIDCCNRDACTVGYRLACAIPIPLYASLRSRRQSENDGSCADCATGGCCTVVDHGAYYGCEGLSGFYVSAFNTSPREAKSL
jgi:hypothetical protein